MQGHPGFAVVGHFDPARFEVGDVAIVAAREFHAGVVAGLAQIPVDRHGERFDVALADIVVAVLEFGRYVAVDRQFGAAAGVPRAACHEDPFAAVGEEGIERDVVEHGVVRSDLEFGVAFQLYGQRVEAVGRQLRLVDLEMRHGLALAHFELCRREGDGVGRDRQVVRTVLGIVGVEHFVAVDVFGRGLPLVVEFDVGGEVERLGGAQIALHHAGVSNQHLGLRHLGIDQDAAELLVYLRRGGGQAQRDDVGRQIAELLDLRAVELHGERRRGVVGIDRSRTVHQPVAGGIERRIGSAVGFVVGREDVVRKFDPELGGRDGVSAAESAEGVVDGLFDIVEEGFLQVAFEQIDDRVQQVVVAVIRFAAAEQQRSGDRYDELFEFHDCLN